MKQVLPMLALSVALTAFCGRPVSVHAALHSDEAPSRAHCGDGRDDVRGKVSHARGPVRHERGMRVAIRYLARWGVLPRVDLLEGDE